MGAAFRLAGGAGGFACAVLAGLMANRGAEAQRHAKPVTVGRPGDYQTIQAAIDAAPPDGSLIRIQPGTYREEITVAKPYIEP